MSDLLHAVDTASDAELISAVRGGDGDAYGELYRRHVDAARRLGRQLTTPSDADDLVSEAFAKVLVVLQRGGGPDLAFRAYLLTAVRRLHVDRIRATSRLQTTDDLSSVDPGVPFRDTAVEGFESAAAARAFASLPERWQMVLWHTEVEGQKPAEVAPLLGMSANSVAALAYRAREGLRQAFLTMHVQDLEDDACSWTHRNLGAYVRNGTSRRDTARVEAHLAECRSCTAIYLELTEVNSNLAGIIAPLLLGGAAAAYLGTTLGAAGAVAGKGALLVLLDRAKDVVLANVPATAAAGVAVAAVAGGAVFWSVDRGPDDAPVADPPSVGPASDRGDQREPGPDRERRRPDRDPTGGPPAVPTQLPSTPDGSTAAAPDPSPPVAPSPPPSSDPPSDPPTDPPTPAPDLTLSASAETQGGGVHTIVVRVVGLAPGSTATLTIEGHGAPVVLSGDDRCERPMVGSGTCTVPEDTTYEFTGIGPVGLDSSLVFTVVPDGQAADAEPSDNRATVELGP